MSADERNVRLLLLATTLVAALVFVSRVVPALRVAERSAIERAALAHARLRSAEALTSASATLTQSAEDTGARAEQVRQLLISAGSPAAAGAELRRIALEQARAHGLTVSSNYVLAPDSFVDGRAVVAVQVVAVAGDRSLRRWLASMEFGERLIRTRDVNISQPAPYARDEEPEALQLSVNIEALVLRASVDPGIKP